MIHHHVCPLCSSENIKLNFSCADHFISKEVFAVYKCTSCSFEFTQDYPDESLIGRYYESEDYISHSDTSKGVINKAYRIARDFMLREKNRIVKTQSGLIKGSILDVGCGTGHFAGTMKNDGWEVKGIEINEKARNFSESKFGLDVISPDMIASLESDSLDCITLWHVLEHFHDPEKYISELFRLLKPGGLCIIALPNCSSADAIYFRQFWAAYDVPRHLWHFNPSSFMLFSEKAGFSLEKILSLPLDVFYISILSEKYRGSNLPFLAGMIRALSFSILSVFQIKKTSSLIYILRK